MNNCKEDVNVIYDSIGEIDGMVYISKRGVCYIIVNTKLDPLEYSVIIKKGMLELRELEVKGNCLIFL